MSGFHEVRFPDNIAYGATGGPEFATTVVATGAGHEKRNVNWSEARGRWDVASGLKKQAQIDELIAFFRARRGKAYGFRFKDWTDYKATGQLLGTGDDAQTQFQLVKHYPSGSVIEARTIAKPVAGTVKVYLDDVEQVSGWSVDTTTGLVTDHRIFTLSEELSGFADGWFDEGAVTFETGANAGRTIEVKSWTQAIRRLELWAPTGLPLAVGDQLRTGPANSRAWPCALGRDPRASSEGEVVFVELSEAAQDDLPAIAKDQHRAAVFRPQLDIGGREAVEEDRVVGAVEVGDRVVAVVDAGIVEKQVSARTAGESVVATPPVDLVVALAAICCVVAIAAKELVVALTAIEHVVALAAEDLVVPAEPLDVIGFWRAVEQVVAGGADDALRERHRGQRGERNG
jgi:uncharacterized protein (TIGR02217 family)